MKPRAVFTPIPRRGRRRSKTLAALLYGLPFLFAVHRVQAAQDKQLTVWLMPAEPAGPNDAVTGEQIRVQMAEFNNSLAGKRVTVLNTQPPLAQQMIVRNPQIAVVNWAWVSNQRLTLDALERFAMSRSLHVNIRFITWDEAFEELRHSRKAGAKGPRPDVAQIGTTWTGYFAAAGLLVSKPGDSGNWRPVRNHRAAALPYINDVRLLYYWKRRFSQATSEREFRVDATSWNAILESFRKRDDVEGSLALPRGLSLNALHDYACLVWAGRGRFLTSGFRDHADLTSAEALAVPLLLTKNAYVYEAGNGSRQIVSFPDAAHEEVSRLFVNGEYRATIEPADFISRWYIDFVEKEKARMKTTSDSADPMRSFWDYAAAVAPPVTFKGGSELIVMPGTAYVHEAFDLAEFLATDSQYTEMLARFGHLPSLRAGFGLDILVRDLSGANGAEGAAAYASAAQQAIVSGHAYPDLDTFPTEIESRPVIESFQSLWWSMAQSDPRAVKAAAAQTEVLINSRIDWTQRVANYLRASLPFLLLIVIAGVTTYVWILHANNERRLAVLLYHSYLHATLPSYGTRLMNCAATVRKGLLTPDDFLERVESYAGHLAGAFYSHTSQVSIALGMEMQRARQVIEACKLARQAKEGADILFKAVWMDEAPAVSISVLPEGLWAVKRMPHLALIVLQEWFYNTIREIAACAPNDQLRLIKVQVGKKGYTIDIPLALDAAHIRTIQSRAEKHINLVFGGMGLRLLVNLMWLAYHHRPHIDYSDAARGTRIHLDFPMKRIASGAAS